MGDYIEARLRIHRQPQPEDSVISTGRAHAVLELVRETFSGANLGLEKLVRFIPKLLRLSEVEQLIANPARAEASLGWQPRVNFQQLAWMMVDGEVELRLSNGGAP